MRTLVSHLVITSRGGVPLSPSSNSVWLEIYNKKDKINYKSYRTDWATFLHSFKTLEAISRSLFSSSVKLPSWVRSFLKGVNALLHTVFNTWQQQETSKKSHLKKYTSARRAPFTTTFHIDCSVTMLHHYGNNIANSVRCVPFCDWCVALVITDIGSNV